MQPAYGRRPRFRATFLHLALLIVYDLPAGTDIVDKFGADNWTVYDLPMDTRLIIPFAKALLLKDIPLSGAVPRTMISDVRYYHIDNFRFPTI